MLGFRRSRASAGDIIVPGSAPEMASVTTVTPVIAAHGGAGATTLCRWLGYYAQDWGMSVPPDLNGGPVVVVARATAHGTLRATELVRYLNGVPGCGRIVLAVTDDGLGPEPAAARARLRAIRPHVAATVRIPYVARWRYEDDPLSRAAPAAYAKQVQELRAVIEPETHSTGETRRRSWAPSAT